MIEHVAASVRRVVKMSFSVEWDREQLSDYLSSKGIHEDIVSVVHRNRINGALFVGLSPDVNL